MVMKLGKRHCHILIYILIITKFLFDFVLDPLCPILGKMNPKYCIYCVDCGPSEEH